MIEKLLVTVTIGWDVIFWELIVLLALTVVLSLIAVCTYNKAIREYNGKNWKYVLKNRKIITLATVANKSMKNTALYMIALSYFESHCDEDFCQNIMKISDEKIINRKYFWLSVYYLLQDDEKWQEWYAQLKDSSVENEKERFLKEFVLCEKVMKQNDKVNAEEKSKIASMHSERLKNILLKNIR